jgi:hypothetical protein
MKPSRDLSGNPFEGTNKFDRDNVLAVDFVRWAKGNYLTTTPAEIRQDSEFSVYGKVPATQSAAMPMRPYWRNLVHR